jgi:two-component system, NarL family, nitrate/nitrite response regulator NarL
MPDAATPTRIVIADDHPIFRDGLRRLLEAEPGIEVVGEAADAAGTVRVVTSTRPDLLLLDLSMPGGGGLEALRDLVDANHPVTIVVLTAAIDRRDTLQALQLGARGVVLKETATAMLYKCIRAVMAGEYWVGHDRVVDLVQDLMQATQTDNGSATPASALTPRELQIVSAIVDGAANKDIAAQFGLSEQTVKNHLSHIFDKLGVSNRLELALYAVHHRLLAGTAPWPKGANNR